MAFFERSGQPQTGALSRTPSSGSCMDCMEASLLATRPKRAAGPTMDTARLDDVESSDEFDADMPPISICAAQTYNQDLFVLRPLLPSFLCRPRRVLFAGLIFASKSGASTRIALGRSALCRRSVAANTCGPNPCDVHPDPPILSSVLHATATRLSRTLPSLLLYLPPHRRTFYGRGCSHKCPQLNPPTSM